jgi:hypothetical protein
MNTHHTLSPLWVAILALGCGMPATESDVKLAGVGLTPDQVGEIPDFQGGLIEYNLIDFAGAQLPLGLVGLSSYGEVGPDVNFRPPYKMVMGQGFVFQDDAIAPDATMGTLAKPPAALGVCQTRYEPRSYLSGLADVGNSITFTTKGGAGGWTIGRRPFVYPPDVRDVFVYYMEIDVWKPTARLRKRVVDGGSNDPTEMVDVVLSKANFPEGREVEVNFPGGVPPLEAGMGSIPVPLSANGTNRSVMLPHSPKGVLLGWNGPRYDRFGRLVESNGVTDPLFDGVGEVVLGNSTCLQYLPHGEAPSSTEDCLELQEPPRAPEEFLALGLSYAAKELNGQMYTGPWDTDDQQVVFQWEPEEHTPHEIMTLSVRFLGPVDREDENMVEGVVIGDPAASAAKAQMQWDSAIEQGKVPSGFDLPAGKREALACDEPYEMADPAVLRDADKEIEWPLDANYTYEDGSLVPSLQGDPGYNLAEVTCRLDKTAGQFILTQDILDDAMDYAALHGAQGAVFFLSRSTETQIDAPAVRDRYGKAHHTSPIKVVSRSIQVGRFWFGQ